MTWNEALRKMAHLAAFWPALLLPWLSPVQAMGIAFALVFMNMFLLPRFAKSLYRSHEPGMGALEIVLYPCAVLACIVAFGFTGSLGKPAWYLPVMVAWFALAVVDALIGFTCRLLPKGPTLPWNARKPILAVILGAGIACLTAQILIHGLVPAFIAPDDLTWQPYLNSAGQVTGHLLWLYAFITLATLAESAWFGIADNLLIPFFICIAIPLIPSPFFSASPSTTDLFSLIMQVQNGQGLDTQFAIPRTTFTTLTALAPLLLLFIPLAFGILSHAAGLLTRGGAFLGGLLSLVLILAHPWLFAFMGGFFILGNAATKYGFKLKLSRGIAEPRGGKRGAGEVFGAMGIAAWMTPLVHLTQMDLQGFKSKALLVCIAPLIAKTMDTVSSEIGKMRAGKTYSIKSFQLVTPGTPGGISIGGSVYGLLAAAILAFPIVLLGWGRWLDILVLLGISLIANLFEALWNEWAGPRGMSKGAHTNVLMTLVAAVLAWLWWFGLA